MDTFYEEINDLVQDLLLPVRTEKKINKQAFDRFYKILLELENVLKNEEYIPRKIAGILFFISNSISAEASGCRYDNELFIAAAKIEDMLDKILWDSPFKNI